MYLNLYPGDRNLLVRKYGDWYPATVVHATPTRVQVTFTTKGGVIKTQFVSRWDVKRPGGR